MTTNLAEDLPDVGLWEALLHRAHRAEHVGEISCTGVLEHNVDLVKVKKDGVTLDDVRMVQLPQQMRFFQACLAICMMVCFVFVDFVRAGGCGDVGVGVEI